MEASNPAVSVVLPTFNEAESLPVIVPRIVAALRDAGIAGEVIVVDDNSPDGTAEVAERLALEYPVRVQKRTGERGLATAVLAGFAISEAPVCVVMDADGSHPVDALPAMVRMVEQDKADIVVGSRHVSGGGSRDWPVFSQLKSKLAAALSFGVTNMTDPTTGFMALRRSLLANLKLDPVGWKIVLEIVVKAAPVRVAEVPIIFTDRELGESKQSARVFLEYASHLTKLYAYRYPALAELVKFCVVGVIGMLVDLTTVISLKEWLGLDTRLCAVFGFAVAVTSNFVLNRKYTFRQARELPVLFSYVTYVGTNLAGLAVRMLAIQAFIALEGIDAGHGYVVSNVIGIMLATLLNFVGAKFFAFDPQRLDATDVNTSRDSGPDGARARSLTLPPLVLAFFVLSAGYAFASGVLRPELSMPDEGVNVTMAQNIRHSRELFVRPSVYPGGRADWRTEDLPALGNLPCYPLLLSLTPARTGLSGMALVSFVALCVTIVFSARLCALVDPSAGVYTALLMAASPALLSEFRRIEYEPVLTAFGAAGLFWFVRGALARARLRCFIGGACLGLAFLTKLWLIVPYAFALFAFCVVEAAAVRRDGASTGLRRSVAFGALGFLLLASAHVSFVAIVAPSDLPLWLSHVYLGIFSGQGVTGDKLSALTRYAEQSRSAFYYPLALYRDHFFLAPLVLFGLGEALRAPSRRAARVLALIAGALAALVALSVPAVKTTEYSLAVQPFLYMLAGLCLAALANAPQKMQPAARGQVRLGMAWCVASGLLVPLARLLTLAPTLPAWYLLAHPFGMLLVALLGVTWLKRRSLAALPVLLGVGLVAFAAAERLVAPAPPYQAIAAALAPHLSASPGAYPSFLARDHELLQGYLGRSGIGFDQLPLQPEEQLTRDLGLAGFVFTPDDTLGREPRSQAAQRWLLAHGHELSGPWSKSGYRVLVR